MLNYKKSLGQNFLIDQNIIRKITSITQINNKDIIEIGPGSGNLSQNIIKYKPKKLILIEKDSTLVEILKKKFFNHKNVKIINKDLLELDLKKIIKKGSIVFGNLPYNISSQILIKFLRLDNWPPLYSKLIFMFQKEVGEKIIANLGDQNYSRLSIITKSRFKILNYFYVSKNCFFPKPKVDSIVIEFQPIIRKDINFKSIKSLEYITNIFFSNRRKMINKTFKKLKIDNKKFLSNKNIDLTLRPENLSEDIYYKITEYYEKKN